MKISFLLRALKSYYNDIRRSGRYALLKFFLINAAVYAVFWYYYLCEPEFYLNHRSSKVVPYLVCCYPFMVMALMVYEAVKRARLAEKKDEDAG